MSDEELAVKYDIYCLHKHPLLSPPHEDYVVQNEVEPLKRTYADIFGSVAPKAVVVRIVSRGLFHEVDDHGTCIHATSIIPPYLARTLQHLEIDTLSVVVPGVASPVRGWRM